MSARLGRLSGDAVSNLQSLKGLSSSTDFLKTLDGIPVDSLKSLSKSDMTDLLKGLDDAQLAKIGKKLDADYISGLNPELAVKLKPPTTTSKFLDGVKSLGNRLGNNMSAFKQKVGFGAKQVDDGRAALKNNNSDEIAESVESGTKNINSGTKTEADNLVRGTKEGTEGLMKTGLYVTGGVVFAMMLYDTLNPFEAVQKAVKETGQVVRGLKEVADEAADAAKDVAKGGFDFVSFVTNNSWLSSLSSVLCLILVFAVVAMSFLGGK